MFQSRSTAAMVRLAAAILLWQLSTAARADDWLQFRGDAQRAAASKDRVTLPLVDIWEGDAPGAIWHGHVFAIDGAGASSLTCTDARTGVVVWRRSIPGRRLIAGNSWPAVSQEGIVFTADLPIGGGSGFAVAGASGAGAIGVGAGPGAGAPIGGVFRAFHAETGQLLASYPQGPPVAQPAPRLLITDTPEAPNEALPPAAAGLMGTGIPLVSGNQLIVTSGYDLVSWTPGAPPQFSRLVHTLPTPAPLATIPDADLAKHPTALTEAGVALIGEAWYPFVAVMAGGQALRWHRDLSYMVGMPAAGDGGVYVQLAGMPAGTAILALDAATGAPRWNYELARLPPDVKGNSITLGQSAVVIPRARGTVMTTVAAPNRVTHILAPGPMALAAGRLYAVVNNVLVALDTRTGAPLWRRPLGQIGAVQSLAATPDMLLATVGRGRGGDRLIALRMEDGKTFVDQALGTGGPHALALADGMAFVDGSAYAPAERTFSLAADSERREDYQQPRSEEASPVEEVEAPPAPSGEGARGAEGGAPPGQRQAGKKPALADATVLRLPWDRPPEEMLAAARERRKVAGSAPLLLALDWLDATRSHAAVAPAGDAKLPAVERFTEVCRQLAAAVTPEHFDIGLEVNVYLIRHPDQVGEVQSLLAAAKKAIHEASPATKVLASFNVEVLAGLYGRGRSQPFGALPARKGPDLATAQQLAAGLDEVGLTSYPQSAFQLARQIPGDFILWARAALGNRPTLVTGISVQMNSKAGPEAVEQAAFLRRALQLCYWLDASVIAYPEVTVDPHEGEIAARAKDADHPALGAWDDVLSWKRVAKLTLPGPLPPSAPPAAEPAGVP